MYSTRNYIIPAVVFAAGSFFGTTISNLSRDFFEERRVHAQAPLTLEGRLHIEGGDVAVLATENMGNYVIMPTQDIFYQHAAGLIPCDGKKTRITYRLNDEKPRLIEEKDISSVNCE